MWSATTATRGDIFLGNQENKHKESTRRSVPVEITNSTDLVSCDGLGEYDWSDQAEEGPNYALMTLSLTSSDLKVSNDSTCSKSYLETINHLKSHNDQLLKDLKKSMLMVLDKFVNKPVVENSKAKTSEEEPKGNPEIDLQDQGAINSRSSRQMTWNMSYLINYKEIDGGYVAFGGNPKGGKITGKTEAVNIACYVQNRMCPVNILNTLDHLGKFNGKANEGFFVGYSLNSTAFRVFNSRTRIVEENLHIRFSETTPNVVGSGPDWLFNIDALTSTINYEPIVAGTQSNVFAGKKPSNNAG
nr:retrovirus-related Pol polyprotein from transposon TNT 1-94 [Tanacetum cinerariifolium]